LENPFLKKVFSKPFPKTFSGSASREYPDLVIGATLINSQLKKAKQKTGFLILLHTH
jgi:hypothetical protein